MFYQCSSNFGIVPVDRVACVNGCSKCRNRCACTIRLITTAYRLYNQWTAAVGCCDAQCIFTGIGIRNGNYQIFSFWYIGDGPDVA